MLFTEILEEFRGFEEIPHLVSAELGQLREELEARVSGIRPKIKSFGALIEGILRLIEEWVESFAIRLFGENPWSDGRWTRTFGFDWAAESMILYTALQQYSVGVE